MNKRVYRLVMTAVFCALTFTMTWIAIPAPVFGNVNLGDCMVILAACILGGWFGAASGAVGAALCDLASGYVIYAPGTLVIKILMGAVVVLMRKRATNKIGYLVIAGVCAECVMIAGYFVYEAVFMGFGMGASVNIAFNCIQGALNVIVATLLYSVLKKAGIVKK